MQKEAAARIKINKLLEQASWRFFDSNGDPETLELPLHWKKPQTIFVNSMSDPFHDDIPDDFIFGVFDVMRRSSWHTFQILTKRARRLARLDNRLEWLPTSGWA
jgi:protein gp37